MHASPKKKVSPGDDVVLEDLGSSDDDSMLGAAAEDEDPFAAFASGSTAHARAAITQQPHGHLHVPIYDTSEALGHRAPRAFTHGVLCGCNDEPTCTTHAAMACLCPCFLIARLRSLEGYPGAGSSFRRLALRAGVCQAIALLGYVAIAVVVPLIMAGRALPPPPQGRVDPTYYIRLPAYATPVGHLAIALLVAAMRREYRARHRITRAGSSGAAESLTDEDEACAAPCCLCNRCDNVAWAALCSCCLLVQMADDFEVTSGEKVFPDGSCSAAGLFADPEEARAERALELKKQKKRARQEARGNGQASSD